MTAVRGQGYYPGAYASHYDVGWLRALTSAIWTFELPNDVRAIEADLEALGRQNPEIERERTSRDSGIMEQLFKIGALGYDPSRYPHGRIRRGCIGTQYRRHQYITDDPSLKALAFDRRFRKASDPSDSASTAQGLNITHPI